MTGPAPRRRRLGARIGAKRGAVLAVAVLAIALPFGLDAFQLTTATFVPGFN